MLSLQHCAMYRSSPNVPGDEVVDLSLLHHAYLNYLSKGFLIYVNVVCKVVIFFHHLFIVEMAVKSMSNYRLYFREVRAIFLITCILYLFM
jgi:hypothetical protein